MEEKKTIKVSLGTVICIFIIILLIVALGLVYYLGFIKNNDKISELELKIIALENNKTECKEENIVEEKIQSSVNQDMNKELTEKDVMEWYSNLSKKLFGEFLSKQKDVSSYKINHCNMIYYYNDEFICSVNYDIKPNGNLENSPWIAGNGKIEGDWIKGKSVFLNFKKKNGEFVYNEEAGQATDLNLETNN